MMGMMIEVQKMCQILMVVFYDFEGKLVYLRGNGLEFMVKVGC